MKKGNKATAKPKKQAPKEARRNTEKERNTKAAKKSNSVITKKEKAEKARNKPKKAEESELTRAEYTQMLENAGAIGTRLEPFISAITANSDVITGAMATLSSTEKQVLRSLIRRKPEYLRMKASLAGVISI